MTEPANRSGRRFRPVLLPTLATIAVVAVCVTAGIWQHGRMAEKLAARAQLDAAARSAPVPLPVTSEWEPWRFRPVIAVGTFDAAHQILVDNRIHEGRVGYDVVTPLALADGRVVLVGRGWVAGGATRAQLPAVSPPPGVVAVTGRVNSPPAAFIELARDTVSGPVWQNLDLKRYAGVTGLPVLPIVIEQALPLGNGDVLLRDWPAPDLGVEKHLIYMVQWFIFAALAAGLWAYFTWRRSA